MSESVKVIADKQDLVSIADAIRAKTETTDGINFADMAALIEGIEAGAKVAYGSFTLDSDTNQYEITHGLGDIPNMGLLYPTTKPTSGPAVHFVLILPLFDTNKTAGYSYNGTTLDVIFTSALSMTTPIQSGLTPTLLAANKETVTYYETARKLIAGIEYRWIVGVI